jgi:hypothetical protein
VFLLLLWKMTLESVLKKTFFAQENFLLIDDNKG